MIWKTRAIHKIPGPYFTNLLKVKPTIFSWFHKLSLVNRLNNSCHMIVFDYFFLETCGSVQNVCRMTFFIPNGTATYNYALTSFGRQIRNDPDRYRYVSWPNLKQIYYSAIKHGYRCIISILRRQNWLCLYNVLH